MSRCVVALLLLLLTTCALGAQERETWVATWATALVGRPVTAPPAASAPPPAANPPAPLPTVKNQTLRQIVRTSVGGSRVRIVLSNAFGTAPLEVGAAHLAPRQAEAAIAPQAGRTVMFSGRAAFTIPAGATLVSDAIDIAVAAQQELAVDLYLPGELGSPSTVHTAAFQTNFISTTGNHAGVAALPVETKMTSWFLLSRLEVVPSAPASVIVAFGDSITDGARSTTDTNGRWPDHLARRLLAQRGGAIGIVNAGIGGNRLLSEGAPQAGMNALARFDRDVLMQTGVTHVVIMEGINDIGNARTSPSPGAADLIAAQRQLVVRARARGLKVIGATLTPFEGAAYWTPEGEAKRQALNQWIRSGDGFDGVIDFDAATRDPQAPTKFLPLYDSGDHLHPNDAGYRAMGEAVDLRLFARVSGS